MDGVFDLLKLISWRLFIILNLILKYYITYRYREHHSGIKLPLHIAIIYSRHVSFMQEEN